MNPQVPQAQGEKSIKDTILNFIVPIVALVLTLVLVLAVLMPAIRTGPDLRDELQQKRTLEGQLRTKMGILNKLFDFEVIVDENAKILTKALADESSVPELLTQIDIIAKESGLSVTKLSYSITDVGTSPDSEQDEPLSYQAVIINLGTLGGYDQNTTFLRNLANSARLVDVVSYRFSGENDDDGFNYASTFILRSPYLSVNSEAVTDAPITVDISDPEFQAVLETVKGLKHYDITANTEYLDVEESDLEDVEAIEEEEEATDETDTGLTTEELEAIVGEDVLEPGEEVNETEEPANTATQ